MSEPILHIAELPGYIKEPYSAGYVKVTINVTQQEIDAICTILSMFDGMQMIKSGRIPGDFELTMFYRTLYHEIRNQNEKKPSSQSESDRSNSVQGTTEQTT